MLRRAFGALNPAFNAGGVGRRVAREVAGKRLSAQMAQQPQPGKARGVSTKARMTLSSLLWAQNLSLKHISRQRVAAGPFRASMLPAKRPFHATRARRAAAEPTSLGARLKKLSREYGWSAVGVYMALSVLDFPFCFLLVRTVGTDRIAEVEHVVVSNVQKVIPERVQTVWQEWRHKNKETEQKEVTTASPEGTEAVGWGVREADERRTREGASLATQLALAYAIHKSFIFVRVPLTAAILPKVVRVLRSWGWEIGKRRAKR